MQRQPTQRTAEGIRARHSTSCRTRSGGRCNCAVKYEAWVWSKEDEKKIYRGFSSLEAAKTWRSEAHTAVRKKQLRAPTSVTIRQAWANWLEAAKAGSIRNRSGDIYKPSVLRTYESSMRLHVLPDHGAVRLGDLTPFAVQAMVKNMLAKKLDPSTIRNAVMPLRVLFGNAVSEGTIPINPVAGVKLPAVRGRRDRVASPTEAAALIAALPDSIRAIWATAFYAGLRLGELKALRDEDVDLEAGVMRVERSWDKLEGPIDPKSRAGTRSVPIVAALRSHLAAHRLRSVRGGLFFSDTSFPFNPDAVRAEAAKAWKAAGLSSIGFHECRHTMASVFIASGVNVKALSAYLGHASVSITYDRYGHLLPGNEEEAVELVDKFLARATGAASGANAC
jgi:integrase